MDGAPESARTPRPPRLPRRHRTPRAAREIPLRLLVPNLLTVISLCSGMASLHFSIKGDFDRALAAIIIAALFDALDGRAARLLKATSAFGVVLDSIADFLSFGVAPGLVLHQWALKDWDVFGLAAVMTYVLCTALRLARFTAAAQKGPAPPALARFFVGLPSPAAAWAVLVPVALAISPDIRFTLPAWLVILSTFLIGWLMISRVPMFAFKKVRIERRFVLPLMVVLGLVVVLAAKYFWATFAGLAVLYLLTLPFSFAAYRRARASLGAASTPGDAPADLLPLDEPAGRIG